MTSSNFIGKKEKTIFPAHIFNLSSYGSTQILSMSTRWMQNLIIYPRSTHVPYFRWTLLQKKSEIHEKRCNILNRNFTEIIKDMHNNNNTINLGKHP